MLQLWNLMSERIPLNSRIDADPACRIDLRWRYFGVTPDLVGSTVVWQLPELAFASSEDFVVYLAVDGATPVPSFFDVSLELTSEGVDVNPEDNTDTAQVMVGPQIFLPLLLR